MNTSELGAYMRVLIDDPGVRAFPYETQAIFVQQAYEQFRRMLPEESLEISYTPATLTGTFTVDLNNILFGQTPTQTRAMRLTRVLQVDPTTGRLMTVLIPAASFEHLGQVSGVGPAIAQGVFGGARFWLDGTTLRFSLMITGTIQIWYVPVQNIPWTAAIVPGANQYIDDHTAWHDIIALLAAQQYAIKEGQPNPVLNAQLQRRIDEMTAFFSESRSGKASRWVADERW